MTEPPDFRSEKMDSPEGRGHAYGHWAGFHHAIPDEVLVEAYDNTRPTNIEDFDESIRDDIAAAVLDDSELIGFWVAWHEAGGFANLERGGWHRATIFRKLRRFRSRFNAHPDEYDFSWITLDLTRTWSDQLTAKLRSAPDPD
jgi:hypothetical protein